MDLDKKCEYATLFNFYKGLLTPKKQNICDKFYNQDIAMVEIADLENISRQAVKDCLKKCEISLLKFEQKLNLSKIYYNQQNLINKLIEDNPNLSYDLNEILKLWED